MRTVLRIGYTNILLQEGVDLRDVVSIFDNSIIVSRVGKKWTDRNEDTEIEVISVLDKVVEAEEDI